MLKCIIALACLAAIAAAMSVSELTKKQKAERDALAAAQATEMAAAKAADTDLTKFERELVAAIKAETPKDRECIVKCAVSAHFGISLDKFTFLDCLSNYAAEIASIFFPRRCAVNDAVHCKINLDLQ